MKATTEQSDNKVNSIEQTVAKSNVRVNITRQAEEFLYSLKQKPKTMNIATLAAKEWMFEYGLLNYLKHSTLLDSHPELKFISAEKDKSIAMASFVNMPDNATVLKGLFSDIFDSPYKKSKAGFSCLTDNPKDKNKNQYGIVWADYCSFANTELLEDFVRVAENNMKKGLIYLTFCLSERRGAHKASLKDLRQYTKADNISDATADAIKVFAKRIKGKKIEKVFEVIYGGGSTSGTAMVTIGFSVNLPKGSVKPLFFDDSEWKSEERIKRQQVVSARLRHFGGWKLKKVGRPLVKKTVNPRRLAKRLKTDQEKKAWVKVKRKISIRADRGWTSKEIYSDLEHILAPMGKTQQAVSSVLAWRSPKLAKKKVK